jgi:hypothetical protein
MSQPQRTPQRPCRAAVLPRQRRGAVLVEFAFVALGFYVLLIGTVEIGRMILSSQLLNNAARVGARELAMMPLPATMTFEQAMDAPILRDALINGDVMARGAYDVRKTIYDKNKLAINVTGDSEAQIQAKLDSLPYLNRMLLPLMIRERIQIGGEQVDLVRYPGALVANPEYQQSQFIDEESQNRFDVVIPKIIGGTAAGGGQIQWLGVVEEIVPQEALQPGSSGDYRPFSIASQGRATMRGVVCLRINYPYQASMASAFMPSGDGTNTPILADDSALQAQGYQTINAADSDQPSQSGQYGLGVMYAFGEKVRPYRRILSAQCIARRETMTPPPVSGN